MHATDIVAYTFQAENLCPICVIDAVGVREAFDGSNASVGTTVEQALDVLSNFVNVDRADEHSFDSDDFPKVAFAWQIEDDERCGVCGEQLA